MKSKEEELQAEIEKLRKENEALKSSGGRGEAQVKITVGKYRGFKTFRFEGPFRAFSLGARKAAVVLGAASKLQDYLAEEAKKAAGYAYEIEEGDISFDKSRGDDDDSGQI